MKKLLDKWREVSILTKVHLLQLLLSIILLILIIWR
ncbi:hypothetical protein BN3661_02211 [Eubacteriaceae bacterium CHKCI005]|nr:hypothetical protein BN3661_02211 [Eubacteriaceae bacterium CHKCI005]